MFKFILIAALVGFLLYILYNRFVKPSIHRSAGKTIKTNGYQLIEATNHTIAKTANMTLTSVVIGFILFIIVLLLAIKIKILLILLPISLYLIGQLFLLSNHVKHTKKQQLWFNTETSNVFLEMVDEENLNFNLLRDVIAVKEVKSVQKTRGLLYGYYILDLSNQQIKLPYLLAENHANNYFFDTLRSNFKIEVESKLFPII